MPSYQQDYYRILQVHPEADPEVVQAAYRRLARMHHPDTASSASGTQMQLLNEAYEVLSDPRQRSDYDRWYRLHPFRAPFRSAASSQSAAPSSQSSAPSSQSAQRAPISGAVLRPVLSALGLMIVLSFAALDMFRLGIRGLPEITVMLFVVGWLVYRYGGFRDI